MTLLPLRADVVRGSFSRASVPLRHLPRAACAVDLLTLVVVSVMATSLRQSWGLFPTDGDLPDRVSVAVPLIIAAWVVCISACGGYHRGIFEAGTEEFRRLSLACIIAFGLVGAGCYVLHFPLSRGFLSLSFIIGTPALLLMRMLLRLGVHRARDLGGLRHNVLIAGSAGSVDDVVGVLQREPRLGLNVLGAVTPDFRSDGETPRGVPVVGHTNHIIEEVRSRQADVLYLAAGSTGSHEAMRDLVWDLEPMDVQVVVAPNISDISRERVRIRPVGGLPLMHIDPPRGRYAVRWGKRAFDLAASGILLLLASPVIAWAALQIRLHDHGPILFRQTRTGRDGLEFRCLKLRTMVVDAEDRLADLHDADGFTGGLFKMKDDPRVTRPGRWLRRFSLDELPQLLNVWRGEMSLVGPRPPLPSEVERYDPSAHRRLRVRPGLTGLWQVSGRSNLSTEDAIRLDLYYVDNWSVFQDISILLKTVGAVLSKRGAY